VVALRVLGLSSITVGVGMAVAAGVGMAAAVPIGSLADRFGPRGVLVAVTAVRAVAMASYLLVHGSGVALNVVWTDSIKAFVFVVLGACVLWAACRS